MLRRRDAWTKVNRPSGSIHGVIAHMERVYKNTSLTTFCPSVFHTILLSPGHKTQFEIVLSTTTANPGIFLVNLHGIIQCYSAIHISS